MKDYRRNETGGILIKLAVSLFLMTFFLALYLVRHPIFRFMAESWVIEDPLGKADALIVLSDDNFYADRATRAAPSNLAFSAFEHSEIASAGI